MNVLSVHIQYFFHRETYRKGYKCAKKKKHEVTINFVTLVSYEESLSENFLCGHFKKLNFKN